MRLMPCNLLHLLHVGGDKILEIYMAIDDKATLLFKDFVEIFNQRFLVVNERIGIFVFRDCKQGADESLSDFSTRLRPLAKAAGISVDKMDSEILSVISQNTHIACHSNESPGHKGGLVRLIDMVLCVSAKGQMCFGHGNEISN